jgi:hypothetical protein
MVQLRNIVDTWNMVFTYNLEGAIVDAANDAVVLVPESEYQRLLESVKNKRYIENLKVSAGWFCGGRDLIS